MDHQVDLLALYEEWRHLTDREGAAIARDDWNDVRRCQNTKARLQQQITELTARIHDRQSRINRLPKNVDPRVETVVKDLIEREQENHDQIQSKREEADRQNNTNHKSMQQLRQIRGAYANPNSSAWQSSG